MLDLCPCCSKLSYEECCKPLHEGAYPQDALALMRSRYSAYALCLPEYIMRTTHPDHKDNLLNKEELKKKFSDFAKMTNFHRLEIIDFQNGEEEAFVTFMAQMSQGSHPMQLHEKSRFLKIGPQWLYRDATFFD
jgi:SEC-C motif-containing protein